MRPNPWNPMRTAMRPPGGCAFVLWDSQERQAGADQDAAADPPEAARCLLAPGQLRFETCQDIAERPNVEPEGTFRRGDLRHTRAVTVTRRVTDRELLSEPLQVHERDAV